SHGENSLIHAANAKGLPGPPAPVFFDNTSDPTRQGGALHKTVAGPAKTAYFAGRNAGAGRLRGNTSDMAKSAEPITIKKYANRRLYNTGTSTYVTLEDLATMVKNG